MKLTKRAKVLAPPGGILVAGIAMYFAVPGVQEALLLHTRGVIGRWSTHETTHDNETHTVVAEFRDTGKVYIEVSITGEGRTIRFGSTYEYHVQLADIIIVDSFSLRSIPLAGPGRLQMTSAGQLYASRLTILTYQSKEPLHGVGFISYEVTGRTLHRVN